jgi:hypothetical protein
MTVLEMLSKVISTEKLLGLVALAEFVHLTEMLGPKLPIRGCRKLVTTVAADIGRRWVNGRRMECRFDPNERGARPRVASQMQ